MSEPADMAARHGRILVEFAELGVALARDLHARALAAETAKDAAHLALALQRVTRSVRQTLALEARLERDRQRQARDDHADATRETQARVGRRKAQVRLAVERAIWSEADGSEAERLADDLDDLLEAESLGDDFALGPLDTHIARICADLGLAPPAADPREGGDPSGDLASRAGAGPGSAWIAAFAGTSGEGADGFGPPPHRQSSA
jgi:hypothetical protein